MTDVFNQVKQVEIQPNRGIEWCKNKFKPCRNKHQEGINECVIYHDSEFVDATQVSHNDEAIDETQNKNETFQK